MHFPDSVNNTEMGSVLVANALKKRKHDCECLKRIPKELGKIGSRYALFALGFKSESEILE